MTHAVLYLNHWYENLDKKINPRKQVVITVQEQTTDIWIFAIFMLVIYICCIGRAVCTKDPYNNEDQGHIFDSCC